MTMLVGKIVLELALGAGCVHFGILMLRGETEMLPAIERLDLPRAVEFICGLLALVAGAGLIVGLGLPEAGLAGSALAAAVLVVALISYLPRQDPPFPQIFATLALLALVALVWAVHWPHRPFLPSLPS
jgi:peptidoglycan/LPS O-acetylase OafA/YrhL